MSNISRLAPDAIESVERVEVSGLVRGEYSERPTPYMVTLRGETRKRRVYATPIGNVAVFYLKILGETVYCETALDNALYRKGN